MLQIAGIDARLTWLGTNDRKFTYDIPSMIVDNHMITTVYLKNGKKYFLDATEKFCALGDYADRIQGKQVLIEDGVNYKIDSIPFLGDKRNLVQFNSNLELINSEIKGEISASISGDMKSITQYISTLIKTDLDENDYKNLLKIDNDNVELSSLKLNNLTNRDSSINLNFNLNVINQVLIGQQVLINLNYRTYFSDLDLSNKWIKTLDFKKAINDVETIRFKIPVNYHANYIPKGFSVNNEDFSISLAYTLENGYLLLRKEIKCNSGLIQASNFLKFKESINQLKNFYNQSVVFTTK